MHALCTLTLATDAPNSELGAVLPQNKKGKHLPASMLQL